MKKYIRLAIVGTGGMAHAHAEEIRRRKESALVSVCDVDETKARAFAERFNVHEVYTSQTDLLKQSHVDAVINVTPDAYHAPLSLEAIAAGKHVLCEKPLATSAADARKMADAAARKGVVHMVNFSYRNHPAVQRAHTLVQRGDLGRPLHFEASYLQSWLAATIWGDWRISPQWLWRLSTRHGSMGVLGDVGVHILDLASFPLGLYSQVSCRLKTFAKAKGNRIGAYPLDANDSAVIHAEMENGAAGVVHTTRWAAGHGNSLLLRIFGDEGSLVVDLDKSGTDLQVCLGPKRHRAEWKTIHCGPTPTNLQRFLRSITTGQQEQPDFHQGAAIQEVIDACVESDKTGKAVRIKSSTPKRRKT
jgi:predicted dehydrogenase